MLFIFGALAQLVVCNFSPTSGGAVAETPSLFTHGASVFFDNFALRVKCVVESTRRSDDPRGRTHRQIERHTSSRRTGKHLKSNFSYDEGETTTVSDCL